MSEVSVAVVDSGDVLKGKFAEADELGEKTTEIELQAAEIVVTSDEEYEQAGDFGRQLRAAKSDIEAFWKPLKENAHRTHKDICEREKAMLEPIKKAEKSLQEKMAGYLTEKQRQIDELNRQAKEEAECEAQELVNAAVQLEQDGNNEAAEELLAEAELTCEAAGLNNFQRPKTKGVTAKKAWEIVSIDSEKVPVMVNGVEVRPVDETRLMKVIRDSDGTVNIDGVCYKEKISVSFRK